MKTSPIPHPGLRFPTDSADRRRLEQACRDFEALLTAQMLKTMRPEPSEDAAASWGAWGPLQDVMDWELARVLAQRSPFGIADLLMKQLERALPDKNPDKPSPDADLDGALERAARRHGLDPALLRALVEVESGGDPRALSAKGAKGLTQLMDSTAAELGVSDPFDPEQNLNGGAAYLRRLIDRYRGDLRLALAAYNSGPGAVDQRGDVPPYPETQRYVRSVLERYRRETSDADAPGVDAYLWREPDEQPD